MLPQDFRPEDAEAAAETLLRRFASELSRYPELDTIEEAGLAFGPAGPDEPPQASAFVRVAFEAAGPEIVIRPLPGYRRSEMAELAARELGGLRRVLRRRPTP